MKLNVSNELKSRLVHAAENGSVIAKDILSEEKKNVPEEEIIRGTYNCFSAKRERTEAGTFRTGTTRRLPGSRRIGQTWNPPRLWNCSRTCPSTHPTKSIISVVLSHWTAKSRSGCMKA
mgnify:CR=1 FL=1